VVKGPNINHRLNIDFLVWLEVPGKLKILLPGRTFEGLGGSLPGAD
jgi:hypothetical protein